jgi:RND family efflux transporter MFP subunit
MKKIILILSAVVLFTACQKEKTGDQIKNEIFDHKEQIKQLENELKTVSNGDDGKKIKVNVKLVSKEKTKHTFSVTGTAKAENMAFISPEMNGQIKHIYVKEGQFVRKGQLLIALNSNIVVSQIKELKTRLELANIMFDKQKSLWDQKIGKETDYLQAKNQKESLEANLETMNAQLSMSMIKAPFDGIVDYIYVKEGEMGMPGRQVIDLVNLSLMEIEAEISEKYLPVINKGDSVTVTFPTYPGYKKGTIINRTGNIINTGNRTFKISVKIPNKDNKIKPNMLAELLLSDYQGESISIPSSVIKSDIYGNYVYVIKNDTGNKLAEKRYVKTGLHSQENTIIESGLNAGEEVITAGYNLVENGSIVEIVR